MSNELKIFQNEAFGSVRVVEYNGEPWFVAKDVCDCLEIGNSRDALASLDDDEKGVASIDTLGGKQDMSIVSEPGMYSLIMRSRKPEAKVFKRWVTHDVIPALRKEGFYGNAPALPDFTNPVAAARAYGNMALKFGDMGLVA